MNKDLIQSWIRHALTLGGGWLVAKGITDTSTMEAAIGGIVAVVALIWSWIKHKKPTA